ncbi:MAG: hypothetical protein LBK63_06335 [Treponema sp.]|jgi:hypothetical protein|nr:hypothetical protein [Treponema sp.]
MAMTADGMADAIFEAMAAAYEGMDKGEAETKKYFKVFSTGIINHLKSNMDVLPGTFANSGGNVSGKGKVE